MKYGLLSQSSMQFTGNTVLITDGTSEVGWALAAELVARRNSVIVAGRDRKRLESVAAALPVAVAECAFDRRGSDTCAQRIQGQYPGINWVINNVGVPPIGVAKLFGTEPLADAVTRNLTSTVEVVSASFLLGKPQATLVLMTVGLTFRSLNPATAAALEPLYRQMSDIQQSLRAAPTLRDVHVVTVDPPLLELAADQEKRLKRGGTPTRGAMTPAQFVTMVLGEIERGRTHVHFDVSGFISG